MASFELKLAVVAEARRGHAVADIARRHRVSRQSVYRWTGRYARDGAASLRERSHRPRRPPRALLPETEALVCCVKQARPGWGAGQVVRELERMGLHHVPSVSTVRRVLRRNAAAPVSVPIEVPPLATEEIDEAGIDQAPVLPTEALENLQNIAERPSSSQ
jgi:transposase